MNQAQRKILDQAASRLDDARVDISMQADEERGKWDQLPEGLQEGPTGISLEAHAEELEEIERELDDLLGRLQAIIDGETP